MKPKKTAPRPALLQAAVASVPAPKPPDGKALKTLTSEVFALSRLRNMRMKTAGGNY